MCQNSSRSLGRPPVIPKHPAQPFPAFYSTIAAPLAIRTFDQLVAKALVISLAMAVLDILIDAPTRRGSSTRFATRTQNMSTTSRKSRLATPRCAEIISVPKFAMVLSALCPTGWVVVAGVCSSPSPCRCAR